MLWEEKPQMNVSAVFSCSLSFRECFHNSIETPKNVFFLFRKHCGAKNGKSLVILIIKVQILFTRVVITSTFLASSVFLSSHVYRSEVFSTCFFTGCFLNHSGTVN